MSQRDKPRQGVVANTLSAFRNGAVGFIDWLDGLGLLLVIDDNQDQPQRPKRYLY
jgi:hypothetical protein